MRHYVVEADRIGGEGKIRAVCETEHLKNKEEARLFGWGQLRGMGFSVENVRAIRLKKGEAG